MTPPVLLRAADRQARPWKNGGGTTYEVAAWPSGHGIDNFDWRLSIADVIEKGPFSTFPGVDRHLMMLSGQVRLSGPEIGEHVVVAGGASISFAGDEPIHGCPLDGPARDLNLMVRRSHFLGNLRHATAGEIASSGATTILVALNRTVMRSHDMTVQLDVDDALIVEGGILIRSDAAVVVAEVFQMMGYASGE